MSNVGFTVFEMYLGRSFEEMMKVAESVSFVVAVVGLRRMTGEWIY